MRKPLIASLLFAVAGASLAFPTKRITLIVPFSAGTNNDINARDFAQILTAVAKQPVVVENRVGAEGTLGGQALVNAPADGHTLMFSSNSLTVFDPLLKKNIPYDPVKDLVPVCGMGRTNLLINVTGSGRIGNVRELIAAAKQQPGKLTFAYPATSMLLAGELFQRIADVKLTSVPYRSSVAALTDVAGGQVDMVFVDRLSAGPFYASGKLRPIAVSGPERMKSMPEVPSAVEAGIPKYSVMPWFGVYVSGKTSPELMRQVSDLVGKAARTPEMAANVERRGLESFDLCGEALAKYRAEEIELWRDVVKKAGIVPQ